MEYSAVSEVLDADYEAAGTCSEDLHVHAFNPVRSLDHPALQVFILSCVIDQHVHAFNPVRSLDHAAS
jgi:hypothetical protein